MKKEIESLKKEVAKLKKLAYRDHLTGLLNRRGFEDSINLAINQFNNNIKNLTPRRGFIVNSVSLIVIDIDGFKKLNDKYGHPVGDKILKHLSRHVTSQFRSTDLVGRWGGEELVVGLIGADLDSAYDLAEKARVELKKSGFEPIYAFSAGVASVNNQINSFQRLYECADEALYRAKRAGRDRVVKCKIKSN
jgi:diguanylate cyclase (GGDEF)-like protein